MTIAVNWAGVTLEMSGWTQVAARSTALWASVGKAPARIATVKTMAMEWFIFIFCV